MAEVMLGESYSGLKLIGCKVYMVLNLLGYLESLYARMSARLARRLAADWRAFGAPTLVAGGLLTQAVDISDISIKI